MAAIVFFNGQATTCASQITATQTSIVGQSTATWSPTGDYFVRIDGNVPGTTTAIFEIVRVTANNQPTGTITVTRGQGSTSGQAFAANATLTPIMDATAVNAAFVRLDSGTTQAMQAPITVVPGAGLSVPTTSFGSYPVLIDDILVGTDSRYTSATATITFLNTSGSGTNPLPTGFRHLLIEWYARSDAAATSVNIFARLNNISTATYDHEGISVSGTGAVSGIEGLGGTALRLGDIPGASATTNYFGQGVSRILHYNGIVGNKVAISESGLSLADTTGNQFVQKFNAKWRTTGTAITRVDMILSSGNFINGSLLTLWGLP